MKIIVFDTETTGLTSPQLALEDQPHICQFASITFECGEDMVLREVSRIDQFVKPEIDIPYDATAIHGITNSMVADAPSFAEVADMIVEAFHEVDAAVAHNISFDAAVIGYELKRLGRDPKFLPDQTFDTMLETIDLCKIPGKSHSFKPPQLMELYEFLFGKRFKNSHNALYDVMATSKCLQKLMLDGHFKPEAKKQVSLF